MSLPPSKTGEFRAVKLTHAKPVLAILMLVSFGFLLVVTKRQTAARIDWTDVRQPIDGFGASSADFLDGLSPGQADFFFTPEGIGLSILRTQIIPDLATCNAEFERGACDHSNGQVLNGELSTAQMAVARGATVFSTPWSPPGAYKSNGTFRNGGYLLRSHYADWAQEIASYVVMMKSHGVSVQAVSVQNEPNATTDYGSCTYTAQQIHDFIPYLYTALRAVGAGSTQIVIAEQSSWSIDETYLAMADPTTAAEVGILAGHGYSGRRIRPFAVHGRRLWQTEESSPSPTYDGSIADGIHWALEIHHYLAVANVNAWLWWFLTDMPRQGEGTDNAALTDLHGNIPKRTYVLAQWSKFVRPGWLRVGVTYHGPLAITSFKDPGGHSFAIVAVNPTTKTVSQLFVLNGFFANYVTPWLTSNSLSLSAQTKVFVNERRFSYALPPLSVVTFTGTLSDRM